jgi:hypothetical protein
VAGGFRVDLGALEDAAAGVNRTLGEMKGHVVRDLAGAPDDYGHADLAGVATDFCSRWDLGVEVLARDGQQVATRLSHSVQAYLRVDAAATGMLDGILQHTTGEDPGVR